MKMAHSMQGIYSPLPQSLSDSDSEKEISMEPICTSYNSKSLNNYEDSFSRQNGHSLGLDDDIVKIKRGASKMSLSRKIAFVASIILCFLPIIIFLWVLPCSELHTCPVKISNWEHVQEGIELKGPINVVSGAYKTSHNLALMYKGSFNSAKSLKHGVMSFMGLSGNVAWDFEQDVEPLGIDCGVLDTNKDGLLDCLVMDQKGLKAIETVSGQVLWHAHSAEERNVLRDLSLPVIIADLNNDGVRELLSVFKKSSFLILSGRTGKALTNIPAVHCGQITALYKTVKSGNFVTYKCINASDTYYVSFTELEKTFKNAKYQMTVEPRAEHNNSDIFYAGSRKLVISNGSNCPKCHCKLTLYDQSDQVLKYWSYNYAFVMQPKAFAFESSDSQKLKGHLNGFILKIWHWSEHYYKLRPSQRVNRRSLAGPNDTFYTTEVTERVVLITFNDSNIHEINASYTEISQICRQHGNDCQPAVESQEDSLLVRDLEKDSSTELVSFYSSYVKRGEDWHLVSYVKMLRLEEELPKLYGNK
ncbi:uncharacterized protein [Euwallacea similis]|uniref:uncharacterized protein isoform X1 n=1 Tax=Euwallacea similis TaxID=1736056 RepID=UPI00344BC3D9